MNWLIRKTRSELRRQAALGIQPPLDGLQARLEAEHADLRRILSGVQAESVELIRMLRQQGDASDEVAEILGRTLARLGAEVEALSQAVERLQARLDDAQPASSVPGVGDPPE